MLGLWLLGLHMGGLDTGLLFLAPAFQVLLPLLAGRYLGADRAAPRRGPVRGPSPPSSSLPAPAGVCTRLSARSGPPSVRPDAAGP